RCSSSACSRADCRPCARVVEEGRRLRCASSSSPVASPGRSDACPASSRRKIARGTCCSGSGTRQRGSRTSPSMSYPHGCRSDD
ncbi:hypothetical protein PENTCL1PPCAC_4956, partial [Pristionchus entomophagus]